MSEVTDRALLIAAAAGEESAFARLYHRYTLPLKQYFLSALPGNTVVDDLVQQVFVQLLGSQAFRTPGAGPESLRPLLFTIAKNLVRNQSRNDRRRKSRESRFQAQRDTVDYHPDPTEPELERALAELPDHHRRPLLLRFRYGMSIDHIATVINCAPGTVKSRLHYALKRLGRILRPVSPEEQCTRK
jgi:RNA polymerase sigma-70 factor (ECF subfamily)